jgi:hypothetical protein
MADLTEDELWEHYPTFHVNHPSVATQCPVTPTAEPRANNFNDLKDFALKMALFEAIIWP